MMDPLEMPVGLGFPEAPVVPDVPASPVASDIPADGVVTRTGKISCPPQRFGFP